MYKITRSKQCVLAVRSPRSPPMPSTLSVLLHYDYVLSYIDGLALPVIPFLVSFLLSFRERPASHPSSRLLSFFLGGLTAPTPLLLSLWGGPGCVFFFSCLSGGGFLLSPSFPPSAFLSGGGLSFWDAGLSLKDNKKETKYHLEDELLLAVVHCKQENEQITFW